jgi:CheY-like chemotaxis protein
VQNRESDPIPTDLEAAKALSSAPAALDLIGLTANASENDRRFCLAAGMDDYVPKPFVWDTLAAAISTVSLNADRPTPVS